MVLLLHLAPTLSSLLLTDCSISLTVANLRKSKFIRRTSGAHKPKRMLECEWGHDKNKETRRDRFRKQGIWTATHETAWSACCHGGCCCMRPTFQCSYPCYALSGFKVWGCPCHYRRMLSSFSQLWGTGWGPARTFHGVYRLPLWVIHSLMRCMWVGQRIDLYCWLTASGNWEIRMRNSCLQGFPIKRPGCCKEGGVHQTLAGSTHPLSLSTVYSLGFGKRCCVGFRRLPADSALLPACSERLFCLPQGSCSRALGDCSQCLHAQP